MTVFARSKYSPDRRVRSRRMPCWRSVSAATRSGSMGAAACEVAVMPGAYGQRRRCGRGLTRRRRRAQRRAADLAAGGLGQLVGVVDATRVLVGRRLALDVVLQLSGQRGGRRVAVAQDD